MNKVELGIEKMLLNKEEHIVEIYFTLRALLMESGLDLTESLKWGMPHYDYKGIVCGVGAFKKHVSIWFHKGQLMSDSLGLFTGGADNKGMRQIQIHALSEINLEQILHYVKESKSLNEKGTKLPATAKKSLSKEFVMNETFANELKQVPKAFSLFNSLTAAQQREYVNYIDQAKQEATRDKRIQKSIDRLSAGLKTIY